MSQTVKVTFVPAEVTVDVEVGSTLIEAARAAGIVLTAPCGGRGTCGGCAVRVVEGELAEPGEAERGTLARAPSGVRLACRAQVVAAVRVSPLFGRVGGDTEAVAEASDRGESLHGVVAGVDFGTTTVAALLVDAESGKELGRGGAANMQSAYGADVLSRMSAALEGRGEELRRAGEESVASALASAAAGGGLGAVRVERVVVAANTAMASLLTGTDVSPLASHPFAVPGLRGEMGVTPVLREWLASAATVSFVPPMGGFVGGDALAAAVVAGLADVTDAVLLIDIGTNAEIVLATPERVLAASAAAGPAFEGAGISCGGPAAVGAVERVALDAGQVSMETIGNATPRWLSGAGFVSAVAMLRRVGHIAEDGIMREEGPLSARFDRDANGVAEFTLSEADAPAVKLNQLDVRALQLAKAAVRTGVEIVLRRAGVLEEDVGAVLVAGAFGAALDPEDLRDLGVLPPGLADRMGKIGNAALEGAAAMALDPALDAIAADIAARVEHVDLAADAQFNSSFLAATALGSRE